MQQRHIQRKDTHCHLNILPFVRWKPSDRVMKGWIQVWRVFPRSVCPCRHLLARPYRQSACHVRQAPLRQVLNLIPFRPLQFSVVLAHVWWLHTGCMIQWWDRVDGSGSCSNQACGWRNAVVDCRVSLGRQTARIALKVHFVQYLTWHVSQCDPFMLRSLKQNMSDLERHFNGFGTTFQLLICRPLSGCDGV